MNQKTLIVLGAAAIVAVGAALFVDRSRAPRSDVAAQAGMLVADLREHVNDVGRINLTGASNQPLVTLVRGDAGWTVAQRGGYAADLGKLRDFLLKLADASLIEQKTSNKDRYAELGVEDITGPTAGGVLVDIEGLPKPARFIVGTFDGQGGSGTFVRRTDEAQSWLVKGTLTPDRNPADWLVKDLANIAADRIASVTLTRADGKPLRVYKKAAADVRFDIADIPKGREASSEFAANGLGSVLAELRIDDVVAAAEAAPPADAIRARYVAFDGLVVDATAWKIGDKGHAQFVASLDAQAADRHIVEAQATAAAEHATKVAASAQPQPDAGKPAGEDPAAAGVTPESSNADHVEAPLGVSDPAKDRDQRLAALNEEVAKLNVAFNGWSFVLPAYKYANIDKSIEDLLKPVEAKAPAKSGK